jgi:hypothetical protein
MTFFTKVRTALPLGVVFAAAMGFSVNAAAQTCTVDNWQGGSPGLSNSDAGTPIDGNRRYGGPCGLRVELGGSAAYVADDSPGGETTYIVRAYVYLDDITTGDPVVLFAADDDTGDSSYTAADAQIEVGYDADASSGGTLVLSVRDQGGSWVPLPAVDNVGTGWHSFELVWEQASSANIAFSVDGAADVTGNVNTTGITIENAFLGVLNPVTGGSVDFDDFDSRRVDRPGRLCRGDTNGSDSVTQTDMLQIFGEVASGGTALSGGQPDYNESGSVTQTDFLQVLNNHVAVGSPGCP